MEGDRDRAGKAHRGGWPTEVLVVAHARRQPEGVHVIFNTFIRHFVVQAVGTGDREVEVLQVLRDRLEAVATIHAGHGHLLGACREVVALSVGIVPPTVDEDVALVVNNGASGSTPNISLSASAGCARG